MCFKKQSEKTLHVYDIFVNIYCSKSTESLTVCLLGVHGKIGAMISVIPVLS